MKKLLKLIEAARDRAWLLLGLAAAGAAALLALSTAPGDASAAGYYYVPGAGTPVVNSVGSTATNQAVASTNLSWPSSILLNTSVTNVTPFTASPNDVLTLQLNAQVSGANGGTTTNIVWHIGRSVQLPAQMPSGGVTNAVGTGMNIDWFMTATNTVPVSAAAGYTATTTVTIGPPAGVSYGGVSGGAATTYYVGWIDAPVGETVTNYQAWSNSN